MRGSGRRRFGLLRRVGSLAAAVGLVAMAPALVAAHPLGNFTINHYAGLRIAVDAISLDVVIDQAEIPTFQESTRIDSNGDGTVSGAEIETERLAACPRLAPDLVLSAGSSRLALTPVAAGLSFPLGASGAATMRLVCEFRAVLPATLTTSTAIVFEDRSNADRIGWREVVVQGDGVRITSKLPSASVSQRLTTYPADLLSQPLDVRRATLTAQPGGTGLPAWSAPDAMALAGAATGGTGIGATTTAPSAPATTTAIPGSAAATAPAAVPGGVAGEIAGLLGASDLTPIVLVLSFLAAALLGAGHALTPGHGKTIMAAYLVGTRGTARHAFGLGLATAVSHTIGVLLLALLIVVAGSALPADRVYPVLSAVSGLIVVAIGAWLVATQLTRWLGSPRSATPRALVEARAGAGSHSHSHDGLDHHEHEVGHGRARSYASGQLDFGRRHMVGPDSAIGRTRVSDPEQAVPPTSPEPGQHRHGWRVHSHLPSAEAFAGARGATPAAGSLSWRSLFALGLSGGLVPSTNALLILVATVAAGRAAYGVVLVIAFGVGMAAVLVGIGLALVYASAHLSRMPQNAAIARVLALAPAVAAVAVLALGLYLTAQALGGAPVL